MKKEKKSPKIEAHTREQEREEHTLEERRKKYERSSVLINHEKENEGYSGSGQISFSFSYC